jgi:uncharacterized membrane protein YraQ (UPF0718 family)
VNAQSFQQFILYFTSILYEALPFIVLGVVLAGLLEELVPQRIITKIIPRNRILSIAIAGVLGLIFPMCECGIIPVMRRLLRKGVPLSCCTCYLLAGPIINVVVMLSTYVAFTGTDNPNFALIMVSLRVGLGFVVAFTTSLIVDWQYRKHGLSLLSARTVGDALAAVPEDQEDKPKPRKSWDERLGNISETTLNDFVDITVFLILGALLAALSRVWLSDSVLESVIKQQPIVAILSMMALAILLCLCSEADAFVAANLISVPPAAKVAFLVLGPMLDLKLYMMYTRVFRPRLIWTIITAVVVQVFLYSLLVHFVWDAFHLAYLSTPGPK